MFKNKSNYVDVIYILPAFIFITIFFFYPIGYIFGISFYEWNGISQNRTYVGLENYRDFFTDKIALKSLANQFLWGVITIETACHCGFARGPEQDGRVFGM